MAADHPWPTDLRLVINYLRFWKAGGGRGPGSEPSALAEALEAGARLMRHPHKTLARTFTACIGAGPASEPPSNLPWEVLGPLTEIAAEFHPQRKVGSKGPSLSEKEVITWLIGEIGMDG